MISNFLFMDKYWPVVYQIGSAAETYLYSDPNACIYKLGQIGECLAQEIARQENIPVPCPYSQFDMIKTLRSKGLLTEDIDIILDTLRVSRNNAVHQNLNDLKKAKNLLRMTFQLTCWFTETYLDWNFVKPEYVEPEKEVPIDWESMLDDKRRALQKTQADLKTREDALAANQAELESSRKELAQRQADLDALQSSLQSSETALADSQADLDEKQAQIEEQKAAIAEKEKQIESHQDAIARKQALIDEQQAAMAKQQSAITDRDQIIVEKEKLIAQLLDQINNGATVVTETTSEERHRRSEVASARMGLTEAETRMLIDAQLRDAGWEADTENLRYSKGTRPMKGHNMAIAEWPVQSNGSGKSDRADYALFIGLQMVAVVEAKKAGKDIPAILDNQCRIYAANIREEDQQYCIGKWHDYRVPFLFATNGRKYLKQLETASGVWFRDVRKDSNIGKALHGWYSPDGLLTILKQNTEEANQALENLPKNVLTDPDGLNLRDYQIRAIEAAEKAIIEGKKEILLSMATGTGKTRTILGLIYRVLVTNRFRRILFLVDRNALGTQAQDVFKEAKIDELMTLDNLYNIKELGAGSFDPETRIQVATVQSLVRRILNEDEDGVRLTVSDYDLVIVDEAHRGYTLDRDMTDIEMDYRDQTDYISKYRMVLEYFDSVKVAMTATPALHTTQIFGKPVFTYSYREAVIDGWLVDHDAPHNIVTKLRKEGIHYRKGDQIVMVDPVTGELLNGEDLPDDLDFDVEAFNRKVITENFNRTVFEEVCRDLNPLGPEKTLIYAVDDSHADLIVQIIREIYQEIGVPAEAVRKITGSIGDREVVKKAIREFKNETYPTIAVTVDLLTTGIDVPQITTLVFVRRVRSRILFEQMLGRATRLCPEIEKTHFEIYDAVGVFEGLEDITNMKAVSPSASFADLLQELRIVEGEAEVANTVSRICAKLHRKSRHISDEAFEQFRYLMGNDLKGYARYVKSLLTAEAKAELLSQKAVDVLHMLDRDYIEGTNAKVIDHHEDKLLEHSRGYGEGQKPEDYLESFGEFIRTNMNEIEAIRIVCTHPSNLTREDLKGLLLKLQEENFTEKQLNSAWNEMKNEDITADIIAFIRQQALGSPLISHEERVKRAFARLRKNHQFTGAEKGWLDRIEKTMLTEPLLEKTLLNKGSFRLSGGFEQIKKSFKTDLNDILDEINQYLYDDKGAAAL